MRTTHFLNHLASATKSGPWTLMFYNNQGCVIWKCNVLEQHRIFPAVTVLGGSTYGYCDGAIKCFDRTIVKGKCDDPDKEQLHSHICTEE